MRRIVGGKAVDGNVTSPDPNKRGVRSVFQWVAIVLGRKPSSNLTDPFVEAMATVLPEALRRASPHLKDTGMP